MKKFYYSALMACATLFSCSESADIAEDVSFSVSAYLIDVLVEPPKVNDELQYKIVVDKLPDGEYKAVYNSDGKDSHVTIGTRSGQTYNQGTNFDISFTNSTAYLNYTGKNAGIHNIQFKVMNDEYSAVASIEQTFVSEVYCYFDNFSKEQFPVGYTPTTQFIIINSYDESNEFYAEYEILCGEEFKPQLSFPDLSISGWLPGEKKRIASGVINRAFTVEYSQELKGEVEVQIIVSDKYGWKKENVYQLRIPDTYSLIPTLNNMNYTILSDEFEGNLSQYFGVTLVAPKSKAYAEEDVYFCIWADNVIYAANSARQTLPGKWLVGCIKKGERSAEIDVIPYGSLPNDYLIDDSKSRLRNVVLHPQMDDLSWKYSIEDTYGFRFCLKVGDDWWNNQFYKYTEPDKKYN